MQRVRVAVVGGSLGGLTAACLLRDDGHDVTLYERSPREMEERGAGIGLMEATSRYLTQRLGLALDEVSIHTDVVRYLARDGSVVHETHQPYYVSSWTTVYRHLLQHWGTDRYLLGHEMTGFEQDADRVTVRFGNGRVADAELLVCADGVGSVARELLQPNAAPAYAGYVVWRAMVPENDVPAAVRDRLTDALTYYVMPNSHFLVYPIPGRDGSLRPGERLINVVWYRNYLAGGDLDDVMTGNDGVLREISLPPGTVSAQHDAEIRAVAAARLPWPLAEVVAAAKQLFLQVIYDIEIERMAFGRVCLLGDAAYLARPHAAAGTAKAADDGWALAEALRSEPEVVSALAAWEPSQLALGAQLLERTRRMGHRSQVDNTWTPGHPDLVLGLYGPGR